MVSIAPTPVPRLDDCTEPCHDCDLTCRFQGHIADDLIKKVMYWHMASFLDNEKPCDYLGRDLLNSYVFFCIFLFALVKFLFLSRLAHHELKKEGKKSIFGQDASAPTPNVKCASIYAHSQGVRKGDNMGHESQSLS